jgi:hypothetical protein
VATVLLASTSDAFCPPGDLNSDCRVGLRDVQLLADEWLAAPESPADLNGDDKVNLADFAILGWHWGETGIPLTINEFMASNSKSVQDPQGDYDDWVEIHNFGVDSIDIGGMYLTDNMSVPTKWRIPSTPPTRVCMRISSWTPTAMRSA